MRAEKAPETMNKTEHLTIKITPDLKNKLTKLAAKDQRSRSWCVTKFIEEGLKKAAKNR